jgi:hypothetical protein
LGLYVPVDDSAGRATVDGMPRLVKEIDPLRRLAHVLDQFGKRNSQEPVLENFPEPMKKGPVGQFHTNDEHVRRRPDRENR